MVAPVTGCTDPLGRGAIFMLTSPLFSVLIGVALGFLAGLGVGGGSLLILWLTLVLHTGPESARMINLMFFLTAAGSVSIIRWKRGIIKIKEILPAIIAGSIMAGVFSLLRNVADQNFIKKLFGILLILTGIRELFYRPRKDK